MSSILDAIVASKRSEVARLRGSAFSPRTSPRRPFGFALRQGSAIGVIAEVKKASPSRGVLRPDFDPVALAQAYERGGARAISVLTDREFFQGDIEYLVQVRSSVHLPVLRKEFIIDPIQVEQSAAVNADAVLLIAALLSNELLRELYAAVIACDMEPLIEVHDRSELERVLPLGPAVIGINNRNLSTFATSLATTLTLAGEIPAGVTVVSESGIENGGQTARLRSAGVHAVLVGESLVRCSDPLPLLQELSGARTG